MPSHPPCALHSLSHKHNTTTIATKMLASTMQISNNTPTNHHHPETTRQRPKEATSNQPNRLIPQGPTVCQTTQVAPPPTTFHTHPHPPKQGAVRRAVLARTGPR